MVVALKSIRHVSLESQTPSIEVDRGGSGEGGSGREGAGRRGGGGEWGGEGDGK